MTLRSVFERGFSLGAIPAGQQALLLEGLEAPYVVLDELVRVLNEARVQGIETVHYVRARDELRAALDRLGERVALLGEDADAVAWVAERDRLAAEAANLMRQAREMIRRVNSTSKTDIALWTGAAVLGVVGTVLLVRWYGKRRRR